MTLNCVTHFLNLPNAHESATESSPINENVLISANYLKNSPSYQGHGFKLQRAVNFESEVGLISLQNQSQHSRTMPDSQGKQQACKLSPFSQFHWGLCWETTAFQTLLRNVSFLPLRAQLSSLSLLFDPTPAGIRNRNKSSEVMCYSSGSRQWLRGTLPNGDMMTKRRNSWFKEKKKKKTQMLYLPRSGFIFASDVHPGCWEIHKWVRCPASRLLPWRRLRFQ